MALLLELDDRCIHSSSSSSCPQSRQRSEESINSVFRARCFRCLLSFHAASSSSAARVGGSDDNARHTQSINMAIYSSHPKNTRSIISQDMAESTDGRKFIRKGCRHSTVSVRGRSMCGKGTRNEIPNNRSEYTIYNRRSKCI